MAMPSEQGDLDVELKSFLNYNEMKRELKKVDPDLRKEMDRTIRGLLTPIAEIAKGLVPRETLSGWRKRTNGTSKWSNSLAWDPTEVKRGISVRQGKRRPKNVPVTDSVTAWGLYSRSAAGSIFELAGKASSGTTVAGQNFVQALNERHHRPSRLIWRAWTEHGGNAVAQREVTRTIQEYETLLGRRLS